MYKKYSIIFLLFILTGFSLNAQVNTTSPYSRYGMGDIENEVLGRGLGMGGIAVGLRLPYEINISNPASYSAIPNKVFLFQVGMKSKRVDFTVNDEKATNYDFSLSSINAAFSLKKFWGMSFGMNPMTSVGYNVNHQDSVIVNDYQQNFDNFYFGEGGLTKLYWGNSFKYKGLSVGVNASYLFGPLSRNIESSLIDEGYRSYLIYKENNRVKGLQLRYGLQYIDSIFNKYTFTVGGFFENKTELNADLLRFSTRTIIIGSSTATVIDTLTNDTVSHGTVEMPMSYGFGLSFLTKRMIFAADYKISNWEDVLFYDETPDYLTNSSSLAVGFEYTHDYSSKKYLETINFRLGAYSNQTYLMLKGSQIENKGITFGVGFPTKIGTKINIGFDIGRRGTIENNLIKENYYLINLNLNFTDTWFVRRKFF